MDLPRKIEAVLFAAGEPVSVAELARALSARQEEVAQAVEQLRTAYEDQGSGLRILASPEGVQMVTAPEAHAAVAAFLQSGMRERLTPAAAETLAIIAYRGPISRAGVEAIRGVNSSFTLRLLALRGLVTRSTHPSDARRFLYEVSAEFLRSLGSTRVEDFPEYASLHGHSTMTHLTADADRTAPTERRGDAQEPAL